MSATRMSIFISNPSPNNFRLIFHVLHDEHCYSAFEPHKHRIIITTFLFSFLFPLAIRLRSTFVYPKSQIFGTFNVHSLAKTINYDSVHHSTPLYQMPKVYVQYSNILGHFRFHCFRIEIFPIRN